MNTLIFFSLVAISTASASIIGLGGTVALAAPGAPAVAIQGPSSQAVLSGPDGSAIAASAQGGAVAAGPIAGGAITAAVAPGVVAAAPAVVASPLLTPAGAIVAGPSGTIISNGLAGANILAAPHLWIG